MSDTVKDIVYKFRNLIKLESDDERVSNRLLYSFIKSSRSLWMKRELDKKRLLKSMEFQPLECVEMEEVDLSSCANIKTGTKILKTKLPIPDFIDTNLGLGIQGIYTIDSLNRVDLITLNDLLSKLNRKYKSNTLVGFFIGNYFHLYGSTEPETALRFIGIFEDPENVYMQNNTTKTGACCDENRLPCISALDAPFPYPKYLEDSILQEASNMFMQYYFKIPRDNENDAQTEK